MIATYCATVSLLVSATLIVATPCTTHDDEIGHIRTPVTSTTMSTLATASAAGDEMTIAITNLYGAQLSLSFGLNAGFPTPLGNPQPTILPDSSSTQYIYPTGWAGRVGVGPNLNVNSSKIEGSFIVPEDTTVAIPDIDVSYVDGYSVPITCSSGGITVTGCNIELFKLAQCEDQVDGLICLNAVRFTLDRPLLPFFAPCISAAYTFPDDSDVNISNLGSNLISCCISISCEAPPRQLPNNIINSIPPV
jgi:hypothetical protein